MKLQSLRHTPIAALIAASLCSIEGEGEGVQTSESTAGAPAGTTSTPPAGSAARKAAKKPSKAKVTKAAAPKVKKPAKKAKVKKGDTAESTAALAEAAKQYVKPKGVKTAGGNQAIDNGDKTAKMLRGKTLDETYKIAASVLKEPESQLRAKYKHLNDGMQRMNLGNRIRAAG